MTDESQARKLAALGVSLRAVAAGLAPHPWPAEVAEAVTRNHGRRRCDQPGRDQMVYRAGSAMEAVDGLDIPDDALVGFWVTPEALEWLIRKASDRILLPVGAEADLRPIDLFKAVLQDPTTRRFLIEVGVYTRFQRDRAIYRNSVAAFEASPAAEGGAWRHKRPTDGQLYLIDRILRATEALGTPVESPLPCSRGAAHDWLKRQGGNPRFWNPPEPPVP
jgi:hypothetical protein